MRLKWTCLQSCFSFGGSSGDCSLPSHAFLGLWLPSSNCITLTSVSTIYLLWNPCLPLSLVRTLWLHWSHWNNPRKSPHLKILNVITPAEFLLPYKVLGIRTWMSLRGALFCLTEWLNSLKNLTCFSVQWVKQKQ